MESTKRYNGNKISLFILSDENGAKENETLLKIEKVFAVCRGAYRTATTSKMELFVIIVNDFQPLTIITKSSILDVVAIPDPRSAFGVTN